ncbi:unnamed protein product [Phytophthora fragariaefolia]|uniref:Unnamed protein product n=1 Tax=Phytophthora fragariaefolia TaxID=1490495 RepID=A0A9W6Y351_9STRA|nr:unnamed protein product [Phytophthora fragariaefolia]
MFVEDLDQREWDEYAERLTFAINAAQDRTRRDTPFYLVHGWDPRSTLEATIPLGCTRTQDRELRRWQYRIQKQYMQARRQVNDRLKDAIADQAERHRGDFYETLLPEDSWAPDLNADEYEVDRIADMRTRRRTRHGRTYREFQVYWKGYVEPSWLDEADLNCGALLHEFLRDRASRNRFSAVQSHEEE